MFPAAHTDGSLRDLSRKTRSPGFMRNQIHTPDSWSLHAVDHCLLMPNPACLRRVLPVCFSFCGSLGFRAGFCVTAGGSQILFLKLRDPRDRFVFRKGKGL